MDSTRNIQSTSPDISIIVPVHNADKYLRSCLDSIRTQTVTGFEAILVDDGSTDGSGSICDEYGDTDSRFIVRHQKNGGVSSARNLGLELARGEWVMFVDADDTIPTDSIQTLAQHIADDIDFIMAGYKEVDEDGNVLYEVDERLVERADADQMIECMFRKTYYKYQGTVWCKLFRNSVIRREHLLFNEKIAFNEDRLFCTRYLCRIQQAAIYDTTPVYNYIRHADSAMGSIRGGYNPAFITDFWAFAEMLELVQTRPAANRIIPIVETELVKSYRRNNRLQKKHHAKDRESRKRMHQFLKSHHLLSLYWKMKIKKVGYNLGRIFSRPFTHI